MSAKTKAVLKRFAKGFISGAVTTMALVPVISPASFKDIQIWLVALALAGMVGGVNGLILAIQKWASWKE